MSHPSEQRSSSFLCPEGRRLIGLLNRATCRDPGSLFRRAAWTPTTGVADVGVGRPQGTPPSALQHSFTRLSLRAE